MDYSKFYRRIAIIFVESLRIAEKATDRRVLELANPKLHASVRDALLIYLRISLFPFTMIRFFMKLGVRRGAIARPPGYRVARILQFLLPTKSYQSIFAQSIADMREEHSDALARGEKRKAVYILWRDHGRLLLTIVSFCTVSIGKRLLGMWKMVG